MSQRRVQIRCTGHQTSQRISIPRRDHKTSSSQYHCDRSLQRIQFIHRFKMCSHATQLTDVRDGARSAQNFKCIFCVIHASSGHIRWLLWCRTRRKSEDAQCRWQNDSIATAASEYALGSEGPTFVRIWSAVVNSAVCTPYLRQRTIVAACCGSCSAQGPSQLAAEC